MPTLNQLRIESSGGRDTSKSFLTPTDTTYVEEAGRLDKILLIIFMSRLPQCGKVIGFSSLTILSLVFADDVILLASLSNALIVQWFAAQCEIDVMGSLRS